MVDRPPITPADAVRLYREGVSLAEMQRRYATSSPTLRRYLAEAGITRERSTTGRPVKALPMADVIADYRAGMSVERIGRTYGISHMALRARLAEAGETLVPRPTANQRRDVTAEVVAGLRREGRSRAQIATALGVSLNTVNSRLAEAGMPTSEQPHRLPRRRPTDRPYLVDALVTYRVFAADEAEATIRAKAILETSKIDIVQATVHRTSEEPTP
ncbi:hypothetical protein [Iamia sp.]|uniref:hypothetical protein n=1 Tax=Iamia sp. TaxID=2722710 RepID=UPI002B59C11E|nr:hypothetical protein [Iamia sp.]HXH56597.1 hypothetical protein [Iamia sp.]